MLLYAVYERARVAFFYQLQKLLVGGRGHVRFLELLGQQSEFFDDLKLLKRALGFFLDRLVVFSILLLILLADYIDEPIVERFVEIFDRHDDGSMLPGLGQISFVVFLLIFDEFLLSFLFTFKFNLQILLRLQQNYNLALLRFASNIDFRMQLVGSNLLGAMLLVKALVLVAKSIIPA